MFSYSQENIEGILEEIGCRLKNKRKSLNYTREQLAEKTGLSVQTIDKIESGKRDIRISTLIALSKTLGVSTDYILGLSENNEADNFIILFSILDQDGKQFIEKVIHSYLEMFHQ